MRSYSENPWDLNGEICREDPNETIRIVRNNVDLLLGLVLEEKPTTIMHIGRKASHLMGHQWYRIDDEGFQISLLRRGRGQSRYFHGPILSDSDVILLVDTINSGNEMSRTVKYLAGLGVNVLKIFCYLIRKRGMERLLKNGLIKKEQIVGLFENASDNDYWKHLARLRTYFHSRLEPIEPERVYNLYRSERPLDFGMLSSVCSKAIKDVLGGHVEFERRNPAIFPNDVWAMSYIPETMKPFRSIIKEGFPSLVDFDLHYITLNVKHKTMRNFSYFVIIADIVADECKIAEDNGQKNCLLDDSDKCILSTQGKLLDNEVWCAKCIGQYAADDILGLMTNPIIRFLGQEGFICRLVREYRP
ncbi:MAG: hypothetical protein ACFFER_19435 [Candidatus Thorarchaeota archaeon]